MAIAGRKLARGPFFGVFKNSDGSLDPLLSTGIERVRLLVNPVPRSAQD